MHDDRRNQNGKSAGRSDNPLNAVADMAAAAWGAAVGIGCALLGIRRSDRGGKQAERGAGPLPERPEVPLADARPEREPGAEERQSAAQARPQPSAKVAPISKAAERRSAAGRQGERGGARQASPAKQGTAAKAPDRPDKGGAQRKAGQQRGRAAGAPRPKASEKHPAQPRPGEAARAEPPVSGGPPAMAPAAARPERPPALDGPRGGKADDLKQIAGIGPKLEEKLNGLGIYHYDQIAGWSDSAIAWIDAELQAKGRVERDNWAVQAAALLAGAKKPGGGRGPTA